MTVVALTRELADRSFDGVHAMLVDQGLTVSRKANLVDASRRGPTAEVLTDLVREMAEHDVVLVTVSDPRLWSGFLDGFLGSDFRLLACTDEPPERNLNYAATDFVVAPGITGLEDAVRGVIGGADLRPNRYEHAMYLAEAQASRSAGLSGSVGCALIDGVGDVIALGTNEVPRAGGGQYWPDSPDDARDLRRGVDPAWTSKIALLCSVLEYTQAQQGAEFGNIPALATRYLDHLTNERPSHDSAAQALESLGRVVHAELAAQAAAARHGAALTGAEAVVNRPPCRQCLRQLIVTGIARVCYLGHADAAAYPFHADAITRGGTTPGKVHVVPFSGVTPRGYAKTFGRRAGSLPLGAVLLEAGLLEAGSALQEAFAASYARKPRSRKAGKDENLANLT